MRMIVWSHLAILAVVVVFYAYDVYVAANGVFVIDVVHRALALITLASVPLVIFFPFAYVALLFMSGARGVEAYGMAVGEVCIIAVHLFVLLELFK